MESALESHSCHCWRHWQERKIQRPDLRIPHPGTGPVMLGCLKCSGKDVGLFRLGPTLIHQMLMGCVTLSKSVDPFPSLLKMGPITPTLPHLTWLLWQCNEIMFVGVLWKFQKQHTLAEPYDSYYLIFITRGECGSLLL